jgi:hypothetical protein
MSEIDDELREHFHALRDAELAAVPSFAELTARPAFVRAARRKRAPWLLAGGIAALAASAMLTLYVQHRREAAWLDAATTIARWQPPTDALLQFPSGVALGEPIALRASVLDSLIPASRED